MAFNAYIDFGSIKGESTDKDHKDWVQVLRFDHGITQPASYTQKSAGGRSAEEVTHGDFSIVKAVDASSPKLFEACCKGTHLPTVTMDVMRAGGDTPVKYVTYTLGSVLISGVYQNGDPTGTAQFPTETIKMTYGQYQVQYTKQDATGAAKGQVAATWDVTQGAVA